MKQEEVMNPQETQIEKVKPAYIPMMCPVCKGHKTVNWGRETCSVCNSEGFIKVPVEGEDKNYGQKNY